MPDATSFLGATRARVLRILRRTASPIADLAAALGITGNAVRGHVAALQKDGLVAEVGTAPSTGGKPAQLYAITTEGEELFPKAYALALVEVIRALRERDGDAATAAFLEGVGRRAAGDPVPAGGATEQRVALAADVLRSIGGDVEVVRVDGGAWEIRGCGCPLSAAVVEEPDTCSLARGIVEEVTGGEVEECCERGGGRARCRFRVR